MATLSDLYVVFHSTSKQARYFDGDTDIVAQFRYNSRFEEIAQDGLLKKPFEKVL